MNIEERLTRALGDEDEQVDADVARMYAETMHRLAEPRVRRTGLLLWPLVVTVAVLALLVGSVAIIQHGGLRLIGPAGTCLLYTSDAADE